jgi:hypothetical protein
MRLGRRRNSFLSRESGVRSRESGDLKDVILKLLCHEFLREDSRT